MLTLAEYVRGWHTLAFLLGMPFLMGIKCNGCSDPLVCLDCRREPLGVNSVCPNHTVSCSVQLRTSRTEGFTITRSTFFLHDFPTSIYEDSHDDGLVSIPPGSTGVSSKDHGTTFGPDRSLLSTGAKFLIDGEFDVHNDTTQETTTVYVTGEDVDVLDCRCNGLPCEN